MPKREKENHANELENLVKRLQADFDNYRKRVEQERTDTRKSANADLILQLLPVLDNFKRAAKHLPQDTSWTTGIKAIEKQLEEVLRQSGLEPIDANPGQAVDLSKHEVIANEPAENKEPGTIIRQDQSGYRLGGKVLRPAKVIVTG